MIENKLNTLKKLTVLLVEDNKVLLKNSYDTLSVFFKEIKTAENGIKALEIFKDNFIDIIITDYEMPIMDGCEFCIRIRKTNQNIPIVMMSNDSNEKKLLSVISLNLTDYLIKPIEHNTWLNSLSKLMYKIDAENISIVLLAPTIKYNTVTKELFDQDDLITISKSEIKTLDILIKLHNTIVSNDIISYAIDYQNIKSNQAIKNIILRLRRKIGQNTIKNIKGFGYILKLHN